MCYGRVCLFACVLSLYFTMILIMLHVEFSAILAIFTLIEEQHLIIAEMVQTIKCCNSAIESVRLFSYLSL